ncbi:hypothetical protein SSTU70S_05544 [Stutzerimonas stutzeri]
MRKLLLTGASIALLAGCATKPLTPPVHLPIDLGSSNVGYSQDPAPVVWQPVDQAPAATDGYDTLLTSPDTPATGRFIGDYLAQAEAAERTGDHPLQLAVLNQAAELGSSDAHYQLAKLYSQGLAVPQDHATATRHLHAAAGAGNAEAVRVIGWQMIRGDSGPADVQGGAALIEDAARSSVRAQREAGMLFANLYDIHLNDLGKGRAYLTNAYEAGDIEAAYQLGRLLIAEGEHLEAVAVLGFAAREGHAKAAHQLARLDAGAGLEVYPVASLATGETPAGTDAQALYAGASRLMLNAARSEADEARAYAMFSLAAESGHAMAAAELPLLDGVLKVMSQRDPAWLDEEKAKLRAGQ